MSLFVSFRPIVTQRYALYHILAALSDIITCSRLRRSPGRVGFLVKLAPRSFPHNLLYLIARRSRTKARWEKDENTGDRHSLRQRRNTQAGLVRALSGQELLPGALTVRETGIACGLPWMVAPPLPEAEMVIVPL